MVAVTTNQMHADALFPFLIHTLYTPNNTINEHKKNYDDNDYDDGITRIICKWLYLQQVTQLVTTVAPETNILRSTEAQVKRNDFIWRLRISFVFMCVCVCIAPKTELNASTRSNESGITINTLHWMAIQNVINTYTKTDENEVLNSGIQFLFSFLFFWKKPFLFHSHWMRT